MHALRLMMTLLRPSRRGLLAALVATALSGALEPATARTDRPIRIVALGDSLTAGYGLSSNAAFPAVLEQALRARGHNVMIVNAGVNGDTANEGWNRLDASVPAGTDGVIVELGANDMLQRYDPSIPKAALSAIITRLKQRRIAVLLTGMRALPQHGADYVSRFEAIYPELARQHRVAFYPFFLDPIAGNAGLNQGDRAHPTANGVQWIVQRMLPTVEQFILRIGATRR